MHRTADAILRSGEATVTTMPLPPVPPPGCTPADDSPCPAPAAVAAELRAPGYRRVLPVLVCRHHADLMRRQADACNAAVRAASLPTERSDG